MILSSSFSWKKHTGDFQCINKIALKFWGKRPALDTIYNNYNIYTYTFNPYLPLVCDIDSNSRIRYSNIVTEVFTYKKFILIDKLTFFFQLWLHVEINLTSVNTWKLWRWKPQIQQNHSFMMDRSGPCKTSIDFLVIKRIQLYEIING